MTAIANIQINGFQSWKQTTSCLNGDLKTFNIGDSISILHDVFRTDPWYGEIVDIRVRPVEDDCIVQVKWLLTAGHVSEELGRHRVLKKRELVVADWTGFIHAEAIDKKINFVVRRKQPIRGFYAYRRLESASRTLQSSGETVSHSAQSRVSFAVSLF
ncbi:hypothetical protein JAAARDRAFT_200314 [Jaapia argillacea MUCL 33604]|uniref:BAH domain-containing protein n=1 Tax=Jaapia argillacea MUCL 33604 TaxID=933084 RepID=A0A067PGC9_9AGAM|nr:hypothetical protein JAAARDRAFT_200314 [Jaapia argillacea MUCL 33604]